MAKQYNSYIRNPMTFVQILLAPFTLIYKAITGLRNHMFNIGKKKSHQFSVLTVGVGNLRVGGTGKTPMSEYLIYNFLQKKMQTAYLSRGYGRKTKGFVEVLSNSTSKQVGDEALQIKSKFEEVDVAVCEERIIGIPELLYRNDSIEAIVLDDVFQHRHVKPHVQILLTACSDLFYNDYVLPMGRLRERRQGAKRADVIIVTKCPSLDLLDKELIISSINDYTADQKPLVLFSTVGYGLPQVVQGAVLSKNVVVLSALADNKQFLAYCESNYQVSSSYQYADHHQFSEQQIKELIKFAVQENHSSILTTEKDWQRLKKYKQLIMDSNLTVGVIPIQVKLDQEELLWTLINTSIENI